MKLLRWSAFIIWVFIICWLSFSSLDQIQIKPVFGADKVAHTGMYFILGMLAYVVQNKLNKAYTILMILALVLAGTTELVQHYWVMNRSGDFWDFLANCIGLMFAVFCAKRFYKT